MPPEAPQPGSAQDWLRYARSDLQLARTTATPNIMLESLCYHAQQCAEKAPKAVLVTCHVPIPRTHSIGLLLDLLSTQTGIPNDVEQATILTDYAVVARYPGDVEPVTLVDYEQALRLAEVVLGWTEQIVRQREARSSGESADDTA